MKTVVTLISTFFYSGYVPRVPGTAGSLAGLGFALLVSYDSTLYICSFAALVALSLAVVKKAESIFGTKDSRKIVIDEAAGMMVAMFLLPLKPLPITAAFALFRLFDITKPFPIRQAERVASPYGVVLDDLIAGIYANTIVRIAIILLSK